MKAGIFPNQAIKSYLSHQTFTGSQPAIQNAALVM